MVLVAEEIMYTTITIQEFTSNHGYHYLWLNRKKSWLKIVSPKKRFLNFLFIIRSRQKLCATFEWEYDFLFTPILMAKQKYKVFRVAAFEG